MTTNIANIDCSYANSSERWSPCHFSSRCTANAEWRHFCSTHKRRMSKNSFYPAGSAYILDSIRMHTTAFMFTINVLPLFPDYDRIIRLFRCKCHRTLWALSHLELNARLWPHREHEYSVGCVCSISLCSRAPHRMSCTKPEVQSQSITQDKLFNKFLFKALNEHIEWRLSSGEIEGMAADWHNDLHSPISAINLCTLVNSSNDT